MVLATNYQEPTLEITPSRTGRGIDDTIDAIAQVIEVTPRDRHRLSACARFAQLKSAAIRTRLSETVARFAQRPPLPEGRSRRGCFATTRW